MSLAGPDARLEGRQVRFPQGASRDVGVELRSVDGQVLNVIHCVVLAARSHEERTVAVDEVCAAVVLHPGNVGGDERAGEKRVLAHNFVRALEG